MLNYIKKILLFLLPILRNAAIQATADALTRVAYPEHPARKIRRDLDRVRRQDRQASPYRTSYSRLGPVAEYMSNPHGDRTRLAQHDVVMVAFDITGRSQKDVYAWLADNMPESETFHGEKDEIYIDSWWIADDDADGDCDSAVFVNKGRQKDARMFLHANGFVG